MQGVGIIRAILLSAILLVAAVALPCSALAQVVATDSGMPLPGTVGPWKPPSPVSPYFQPVEFIAPPGVSISMAQQGTFLPPLPAPITVGVLVHPVYRLRITGIPSFAGRELFPTLELLDRLCPPPGQESRFAVPVELTQEDLRLALEGHFVTRVIYVEDPQTALPIVEDPHHPNWFDAGPGRDPVAEARHWGRPIAILRLGSIVPDERRGVDWQFLNGCPPLVLLPRPRTAAPVASAAPVRPSSPTPTAAKEPVR